MDGITLYALLNSKLKRFANTGIGEPFDETKSYQKDELVIYNGLVYQFTEDKPAGAWDSSKVVQIPIGEVIERIETKLNQAFFPDYDDVLQIVKLTDGSETLAEISERLAEINEDGKHVMFDTSSLNEDMYLCTIFIGDNKYRVTDAVTGKTAIGSYDGTKTLGEVLSEAVADLVTITVTCTTQDGTTVTGQTVTLRNGTSKTSPVIATKEYNGQPVSFVVAKDTAYFAEVSDTLANQYAPSTASGNAISDTSIILTYRSYANISTFEDVQLLARAGKASEALEIGDTFNLVKDGTTYPVAVMHFIENGQSGSIKLKNGLQEGVIFQTVDCMYSLQFDEKEAFYYTPSGLTAGDYCFKLGQHSWVSADVDKTFYFHLTKDVPAGGQLVWKQAYNATLENAGIDSFSAGDSYTALETTTMSSTPIEGATNLGTINNSFTGNFNSCQRACLGNSRWKESAIRQHLNSAEPSGDVWKPQNAWDRAPSWRATTKGFLNGLSSDIANYISEVSVDTHLNTVCDGGGLDTTDERVFLAGNNEVYCPTEGADNGVAWDFYKDGSGLDAPSGSAMAIRVKKLNNSATYWWWRSPYVGYARYARIAYPSGERNSSHAYGSLGVAPAFVIA